MSHGLPVTEMPTHAVFGPEPSPPGDDLVQLLTPEGERIEHPVYSAFIEHLTSDDLRGLYRDLVCVRAIDLEATALQRQGELGLWVSLLGQEAAQIGSGRALRPQDMAFPGYREHGVAWCRGLDLTDVLRMFRGLTHGGWDPAEHNFHLYTIVIGNQNLIATGYAMGVQRDGALGTGDPDRDTAVIAYFGDGATAQGDVNESFVFAAVANAPVVFFCQNNQYAISEPNARQTRIPLYRRASGFGFPGVRVDGNDVLATLAVTTQALDRARAGEGPTLIEAFTYRMAAHTSSDDPTRYRFQAEVEEWKLKDPIARLKAYLARSGQADQEWFGEIDTEAARLAATVRAELLASPDPDPDTMFDNIYHDPHPLVAEERAWFAAYREMFEDERTGSRGGSPGAINEDLLRGEGR